MLRSLLRLHCFISLLFFHVTFEYCAIIFLTFTLILKMTLCKIELDLGQLINRQNHMREYLCQLKIHQNFDFEINHMIFPFVLIVELG